LFENCAALASCDGLHLAQGEEGQYSDGHEHKDVVEYWQRVFLPAMAQYVESMRKWDGNEEEVATPPPL